MIEFKDGKKNNLNSQIYLWILITKIYLLALITVFHDIILVLISMWVILIIYLSHQNNEHNANCNKNTSAFRAGSNSTKSETKITNLIYPLKMNINKINNSSIR